MTKLRILSDIHLEFGEWEIPPLPDDKDTILILAGDIAIGEDAFDFILDYCDQFKHIIYVLGNHEFYHNDVTAIKEFWRTHGITKLTVLDDTTEIIDGVRFIGGTLWTDMNKSDFFVKDRAKQCMPDFRCATYKGKVLTPENTVTFHNITKCHIINELKDGYDGKTVVITHHMPHEICVLEKYKGDSLNCAFVTDLDELFEEEMDLWVCGHTHEIVDVVVNGTRILCNPLGYPGHERLTNGFDPLLTVDL